MGFWPPDINFRGKAPPRNASGVAVAALNTISKANIQVLCKLFRCDILYESTVSGCSQNYTYTRCQLESGHSN